MAKFFVCRTGSSSSSSSSSIRCVRMIVEVVMVVQDERSYYPEIL